MKRFAITSTLAAMLITTAPAHAEDGLFTGDVRLACEAVLCLAASGTRPSECTPSIKKYFSINAKKLKDTIKKCPKATPDNINAIVEAQPTEPVTQSTEPDVSEPVVEMTK
jgi:hypothetical protein